MSCGVCNDNFYAIFQQLDTQATDSGPGYDDIFHEPKLVKSGSDDKIGTVGRVEVEHRVRVQVDFRSSNRLEQLRGGKQKRGIVDLTADRRTLLENNQIDVNGDPVIRTKARLERIEDLEGNTVQTYLDPPGMFVQEIITDSWVEGAPDLVTWICEPEKGGV